jgi:hypothetical protein
MPEPNFPLRSELCIDQEEEKYKKYKVKAKRLLYQK